MRGKRDSAVRWDGTADAEPATASESAHWGTVGAGSGMPVAVAEQVSAALPVNALSSHAGDVAASAMKQSPAARPRAGSLAWAARSAGATPPATAC